MGREFVYRAFQELLSKRSSEIQKIDAVIEIKTSAISDFHDASCMYKQRLKNVATDFSAETELP